MMFEKHETKLPGCFVILPKVHTDLRGEFVKLFHAPSFANAGLDMTPREMFASWSEPKVIRGMHFQVPPFDHAKLVFCQVGTILDVVIDLRKDSKAFGQSVGIELSAKSGKMIFIPPGFAHGFCVQGESKALVTYVVSREHSPDHDSGILWNSFGFEWPVKEPLLSDRDRGFVEFENFKSPF